MCDKHGCRYAYESLSSVPQKPQFFTDRYLAVKKDLVDTFYGPPKEGVYSPSVQNTLYLMAKSVLNRSLFLSPSHRHAHIHTHTNIHQHKHLSPLPHRFTGPNTYTHALTRRYTCMNMHYQDTSTHSHVGFCMIHSNTYAHALIGRNTCMSMHYQDTFTHQHVDFCMEQCFEIDS